jgi:CheY-like chemotaxis protein
VEDVGHRLLIVPATLVQGEIGASFLDRDSFRVRTAAAGEEAIAIARAWAPALVLIGTGLADMPAARLANRIRREVDPGIKLLLLTEVIEPHTEGEELAADAHLIEPIDPANLLEAVAELLDVPPRRTPRVAVRILARLEGGFEEPGRPSGLANLLCLNEGGVLLEAPGPLTLGAPGTLQFVLPGSGARIVVKVRTRVLIDEIRLHYGVAFVDLDEASRGHIGEYVAARLGRVTAEEDSTDEFDRD